MMSLPERKLVELTQKLAGLDAEFGYWLNKSEAGNIFEKNHTQIRAVVAPLQRLRTKINDRLDQAAKGPETLIAHGRGLEKMILATRRIWEFFRSKLAQRLEEGLAPYLAAADEYAWACYRPAQEQACLDWANLHRKEPPLVFCNGGLSPFALARDRPFEAEDVPNEILSGPELRRVLNRLPVAVVGVPWFQVHHLPDALVIGHEVGHAVEEDFGLARQIEALWTAALERVDAARRAAWTDWRAELVADFYGGLCAGPAYVGALMDFLTGDRKVVEGENRISPNWGLYPTAHLRMQFNLAVLGRMDFCDEERRLGELWWESYPKHAMAAFSADGSWLVDALFTAKLRFGGATEASLPSTVRFTSADQASAKKLARQLLDREELSDVRDARVLFPAARFAYEQDPRAYYRHCALPTCTSLDCQHERIRPCAERILERIRAIIYPGTRFETEVLFKRKRAFAAVGDELFANLTRAVDA